MDRRTLLLAPLALSLPAVALANYGPERDRWCFKSGVGGHPLEDPNTSCNVTLWDGERLTDFVWRSEPFPLDEHGTPRVNAAFADARRIADELNRKLRG